MVTHVVGMARQSVVERRCTSAAHLARALTVMQIGLELLAMPPRPDRADVDRRALVRALVVANEQVQASAAALVPAEGHATVSRA